MDWPSFLTYAFAVLGGLFWLVILAAHASFEVTSYQVAWIRLMHWTRSWPLVAFVALLYLDPGRVVSGTLFTLVYIGAIYALAAFGVRWNRRHASAPQLRRA